MKESDVSRLFEIDWHAQNGLQSVYADQQGCACVYKEGYGQFGAISECTEQAYRDLASIVKPGRLVTIIETGTYVEIPEWKKIRTGTGHGMVLESPISAPELVYEKLSQSDIADMIELANASGLSVFPRTIELGDYYGIKKNGKLVAMAGERAKIEGFTEVANVCTHPDYRKRGYGAGLTQVVSHFIQEKGDTPVLRVPAEKTGAIRLYEKLGFKILGSANVEALLRTDV